VDQVALEKARDRFVESARSESQGAVAARGDFLLDGISVALASRQRHEDVELVRPQREWGDSSPLQGRGPLNISTSDTLTQRASFTQETFVCLWGTLFEQFEDEHWLSLEDQMTRLVPDRRLVED
jgi:hypothetical protein